MANILICPANNCDDD